MKTATRTITTAAAMIVVLGLGAPALGQADDPEGYGDGYQSGAYGRIRFADGEPAIVRADGERGAPDAASVNAPLFPGDTVRTDGGQRVEVQLAGGTIVRIDRSGEVGFQSLPDPSAKYQDNTVLALNAGAVRITSRLGDKVEFRIDTRDASVYLLGAGEFRIETDERGGTRVASVRGVAEIVANEASVLVRGGMRAAAVAGSAPETPRTYNTFASDGFDRWCEARDDAYRVHDRYAARGDGDRNEVPEEVRPYYAELSRHGSWTTVPDYGYVWYPTGVAGGWRPYNDGYWSYGPGGYFWVSHEPWGWAPYHYGNWQWVPLHGWCWVPGRVFAGAWVSWSWGSLYVGWAPLDFWGRPGWIGGPYYAGFYDPGCWTFVGYGNIHARHLHHHAVPIGTVRDDLRHARVVARPPRVDPRRVAESPVWRGRALREVAEDRAAQMRPIQADRRPERKLSEVQEGLAKRSPREIATPSFDRRTVAPRPRRILEDPRVGVRSAPRPDTRDDVRDLYQRMSRPRETRGQDATAPRAEAPRAQAPQTAAPRAQAPRAQTPRPKAQAPQGQRPRAAPQAKPKQKSKN